MDTIRARKENGRGLPKDIRKYSKELDAALLGKHMRVLYNNLKRDEAKHWHSSAQSCHS
jgi:hypothetical protein